MIEKVTGRSNLRHYIGKWHEIASIYNCHNFYANTNTTYTLSPSGAVKVAELYARWSASERRFIKGPEEFMHKSFSRDDPLFWVVHRDDDYEYALLHNSRMLCKQPYMDERMYNSLLAKASEEGYDVTKFRKTSEFHKEVVVQLENPLGKVIWERNLRKYIGQWYEIASFSSHCGHLEKRKTTYSLNDDGSVMYTYRMISTTCCATTRAWGCWTYTPNELVFSVVYCDDDHCALLDHKSSQILYKQPRMDEGIYNQLVEKIKELGIDITKLKRAPAYQDEIVIKLKSD